LSIAVFEGFLLGLYQIPAPDKIWPFQAPVKILAGFQISAGFAKCH